jgi:hypothetical protein
MSVTRSKQVGVPSTPMIIISDDSNVEQESACLNKIIFMVLLSRPSWLREWYFKIGHYRLLLQPFQNCIISKAHASVLRLNTMP